MKKRKPVVVKPLENAPGRKAIIDLVIEQEKLVWKAAKEKNVEEFSRHVPFDAVMIFQSGIVRQPEYLATMKMRTVSHSEIIDMHGFMPDASTVILIYQTIRLGSFEGKEFPPTPVFESTTWIKRDRRWVAILNQETPIS